MHLSDKKMDLFEHFVEGYLLIFISKLFKITILACYLSIFLPFGVKSYPKSAQTIKL
jgi:hypothetical protein